MGKIALKKAGSAAAQSLFRDLMPFLDERFGAIQKQIGSLQDQVRSLDGDIASLRDDVVDRYERQLNLINEVNSRIVRLEGKLEGYMEAMRVTLQPVKMKRRAG